MPDRLRFVILALANVGYAWILIVLSVTTAVPSIGTGLSDKLIHAMAYGGETVLLYWMLLPLVQPLAALAVAWLGTVVLGMLTEILQAFERSRSADVGDLLADMVGATLVIASATLARRTVAFLQSGGEPDPFSQR